MIVIEISRKVIERSEQFLKQKRDWSPKFETKYHNRHCSKRIRVTKLSFCQNYSPRYLAQSQIFVNSLYSVSKIALNFQCSTDLNHYHNFVHKFSQNNFRDKFLFQLIKLPILRIPNILQHLKLGKLKSGIRNIGCSIS